jgi:serine phosphatase RsbU (regulator of sigma subunit)
MRTAQNLIMAACLAGLSFACSCSARAQQFAPVKFYLVDSLDLSRVAPDEKHFLDSALNLFHTAGSDTVKAYAIGLIVEEIWNDHVWPKYNRWMYDFAQERLKTNPPVEVQDELKGTIGTALGNFGYEASFRGDIDGALENYEKSLAIYRQLNNPTAIAALLNNIGTIYTSKGNQVKALEYHLESLVMKEAVKDSFGIATSLNNIASIYQDQGDTTKAIEYYNRSIEMRRAINDQKGVGNSMNNLGGIYVGRGDYKKALTHYEHTLSIYDSLHYAYGIAVTLNNIGRVHNLLGDKEKALDYYSRSLAVAEQNGDKEGASASYNNIGWIYFSKGNMLLAKKFAQRSYDLSKELGYPVNIMRSAALLHAIYEKSGDYKNAYQYFTEEITMRDSINNEASYKLSQKQQARYEYDKKHTADSIAYANKLVLDQEKMDRKNAEIAAKENQQIALYGGLILVLIFSAVMYNRFRTTHRQKQIIEGQKKEVESQKSVIEQKHKEITDSINYAERIQRALMASHKLLAENLPAYFIYFNPKEAVSGDFFWARKLENNRFCLAVADSTGHGVPGAIMSILNIASLDKAVTKGISEPHLVLNETRRLIIENLKNDGSAEGGKDGMDCTLVSLDRTKMELTFALANNPLWICRDGGLIEFTADKMPVGRHTNQEKSFMLQTMELRKSDVIYLFTDGYADQFGGEKGKKYKYAALKEQLISISHLPMADQENVLDETFRAWKGDLEQVDDVCIIGIRV